MDEKGRKMNGKTYEIYMDKLQEELLYEEFSELIGLPLAAPATYNNITYNTLSVNVTIGKTIASIQIELSGLYVVAPMWSPSELLPYLVSIGVKIKLDNIDVTRSFRIKL